MAMIPESFLTAEASERSRAANVSAEFAGIGAGFGGSVTRGDRMSQKVSEKRCHCCVSMPVFNGSYVRCPYTSNGPSQAGTYLQGSPNALNTVPIHA